MADVALVTGGIGHTYMKISQIGTLKSTEEEALPLNLLNRLLQQTAKERLRGLWGLLILIAILIWETVLKVCQNYLVPALDAGSHENWPYKYLIDKACSSAAPRQARGQVYFDTPPKRTKTIFCLKRISVFFWGIFECERSRSAGMEVVTDEIIGVSIVPSLFHRYLYHGIYSW